MNGNTSGDLNDSVDVRFCVNGINATHRRLYKALRRSGLTPEQCTLILWGYCLGVQDIVGWISEAKHPMASVVSQ